MGLSLLELNTEACVVYANYTNHQLDPREDCFKGVDLDSIEHLMS